MKKQAIQTPNTSLGTLFVTLFRTCFVRLLIWVYQNFIPSGKHCEGNNSPKDPARDAGAYFCSRCAGRFSKMR
ncbi:MAG: hypothetical protein N4A70_08015, partial [Pelagimonas sp.]|nr:hypothetical protein [Pelagimonas sp.]